MIAPVFVVTGPSGAGKGTLVRALLERFPELELAVSATTRERRRAEQDGREYRFLPREEFDRRVAAGDFLEHASYSGRRYGTLRSELEKRTTAGHPVVLEIEVQGARQVRERMPDAVQIFIAPPSEDALRARLIGRGDTPPEQMEERLATAREELAAKDEFDAVIVNDELGEAVRELVGLAATIWARPQGEART